MKRKKDKEFRWASKPTLSFPLYDVESDDGNTYRVCAANIPDVNWLFGYSLSIKTDHRNRPLVHPVRSKKTNRHGEHYVKNAPFWCYGWVWQKGAV